MTLTLTTDEAILVRDAMQNMYHEIKNSPSERGQKLAKQARSIADELGAKIIRSR